MCFICYCSCCVQMYLVRFLSVEAKTEGTDETKCVGVSGVHFGVNVLKEIEIK